MICVFYFGLIYATWVKLFLCKLLHIHNSKKVAEKKTTANVNDVSFRYFFSYFSQFHEMKNERKNRMTAKSKNVNSTGIQWNVLELR